MSTDLTDPETSIRISPEAMEVATTYLECSSIPETALALGVDKERVSYFLNKKEIKRFIDTVYLDQGYLNRHKLQDAMSKIIEMKMEELEEAEIGSNKDIADLLALQHKMRMEEIKAMQAYDKESNPRPSVVVNTANGATGAFGTNYGSLMEKLMKGE